MSTPPHDSSRFALYRFTRAVVSAAHTQGKEERAAHAYFGSAVLATSDKAVERRQERLALTDLVVGGLPLVRAALRQFNVDIPAPLDYPTVLRPWLRRELRQSTLASVLANLEAGATPVFVKPAVRAKRFTGFVLEDPFDYRLAGVSRREPVWVSPAVKFVSEYRYYVLDGELRTRGVAVAGPEPDLAQVQAAIAAYSRAGAPCGFALDFGVLDTGETALVEANDAFSLGLYPEAAPHAYLEMLAARWGELVNPALALASA